jgi:3-polyprenyl-4-hydroxybenzoate decarboxylase
LRRFFRHPCLLANFHQDAFHFVFGRVCDQLGVEHRLFERWGEENPDGARE